MLININSVSVT